MRSKLNRRLFHTVRLVVLSALATTRCVCGSHVVYDGDDISAIDLTLRPSSALDSAVESRKRVAWLGRLSRESVSGTKLVTEWEFIDLHNPAKVLSRVRRGSPLILSEEEVTETGERFVVAELFGGEADEWTAHRNLTSTGLVLWVGDLESGDPIPRLSPRMLPARVELR